MILTAVFERIVEISWQASIVAVFIFITQWTIGKHLRPQIRLAMWGLLLARLIMPALPESRASLFNLFATHRNEQAIEITPNVTTIMFATSPSTPEKLSALPIATIPSRFNWTGLFACIWLAGFIFLIAWQMILNAIFSRRLRSIHAANDPHLMKILDECCRLMNVKQAPTVIETDLISVPSTFGMLMPRILLPMGLQLSSQQMKFVLLHELAHVRRNDIAILWIVRILNALHWFNPLLWLAAMRFRAEQELACDAQVMAMTDREEWNDYGRLLVDMLSRAMISHSGAIGIVGTRPTINRRITAIAKPVKSRWYFSLFAVLLILAIGCTTLTGPRQTSEFKNEIVTQIYDVNDLASRSDYDGPISLEKFATPQPSPAPTEIIQTIERRVDPDSWKDRGGSIGFITESNRVLTITQTPANQDAIGKLLAQLRGKKYPQIQLDTHVIAGPAAFSALERESGEWKDDRGVGVWSQMLSDDEVNRIRKISEEDSSTATSTIPRITSFNGQRASVAIFTTLSYVGDFKTEANGKLDPIAQIVYSGFVEDCRTTVSSDGLAAAVDYKAQVSRVLNMKKVKWPKAPPNQDGPFIQIPTVAKANCEKVLTITNNKTTALRLTRTISPPDQVDADASPLLVLVRAKIIQSDEDSKAK